MFNPYAPPNVEPEKGLAKEVILRRLGAFSLAYVAAMALWSRFPDLLTALGGAAIMSTCIYGFLRGGRKSHFGIAVFMLLSIATQGYFMNRAMAHPERLRIPLSTYPWLEFAGAVIPHLIALVCSSALYLKARRRAASGLESSRAPRANPNSNHA